MLLAFRKHNKLMAEAQDAHGEFVTLDVRRCSISLRIDISPFILLLW